MAATKCFHLAMASSNEQWPNNNNSALLMGGRIRSNSVEEINLQVPSLDPRFAIFIVP